MNKFFAALFIALGFSAIAFAQTKGTTQLGINIGLNASNVTSGNIPNSNARAGFNGGISLEHYFSESWSFKTRLIYDQKGWDGGYLATGNNSYVTNYKLDYLTVPLLANWHFGRKKNWYLNFGPYVSFLTSATESAGGADVKPYFNSTEAGFDLGIGVKFPVSQTTKFFIELNGASGISDIAKDNVGSALRNTVSAVNIGFLF